jgi:hypothetical protein
MRKVFFGFLAAALIWPAVGCVSAPDNDAALTPCERDCTNDSGGKRWCADYCKEHGSYGPTKK